MKLRGFAITGLIATLGVGLMPAEGSARPQGKLALGKTSQGKGMGIRVQERTLQMLDFNALLDCRDGTELIVEEGGFLPIRTRPSGYFRDFQYGRTDTVWLRGRAGQKWVRGRLRVTDRWGPVKCDSGWFRFSARIKR